MSRKIRGMEAIGAAAIGIALGLLPLTALALASDEAGAVPAAPPPAACPPMPGGPLSVPLQPQPEVLKGAPYSGVGSTEVVTTLADGNRITRTNTMRYFRDSAGRTRTEYQLAAIGPFVPEEAPSIVTITDPVAGKRVVLHPEMKRADVFRFDAKGGPRHSANAIFVGGAFASMNGGPQPMPSQPATLVHSTRPTRSTRLEGPPRGGPPGTAMITSSGFANAPHVAEPMGGAVLTTTAGPMDPSGRPAHFNVLVVSAAPMAGCRNGEAMKAARPVSIGERRIEGLEVTGSRLEFTIDAGTVGNEQPITVRTDQWFSPDLGVVVSSTHHDPMIGETTYRLEQINRAEPDAALFVVPADYATQAMD